MKKRSLLATVLAFLGAALFLAGCAHTAYLGFHGKSVKAYPDVHSGITRDAQCLECHHPDHAQGPATPHPDFTGCLKCHND